MEWAIGFLAVLSVTSFVGWYRANSRAKWEAGQRQKAQWDLAQAQERLEKVLVELERSRTSEAEGFVAAAVQVLREYGLDPRGHYAAAVLLANLAGDGAVNQQQLDRTKMQLLSRVLQASTTKHNRYD